MSCYFLNYIFLNFAAQYEQLNVWLQEMHFGRSYITLILLKSIPLKATFPCVFFVFLFADYFVHNDMIHYMKVLLSKFKKTCIKTDSKLSSL